VSEVGEERTRCGALWCALVLVRAENGWICRLCTQDEEWMKSRLWRGRGSGLVVYYSRCMG